MEVRERERESERERERERGQLTLDGGNAMSLSLLLLPLSLGWVTFVAVVVEEEPVDDVEISRRVRPSSTLTSATFSWTSNSAVQ